ncbi:MAG TPA: CRTAC1 family protein [Bacteriovoracaceae bacterium]|nr:CRTAC1 family protein [Bacteriovoracaceae bacterium]
MGLALTSSISNSLLGQFCLCLLLTLGCAGKEKRSGDEASIELTHELNKLTQKALVVNFGPTLKDGGLFADKTEAYGLKDQSAVSMNALDLNFDGFTDLVLLPTYYSRPKFFLFEPKLKTFVPWAHEPLGQDFKAGFLLFYDLNKDKIPDLISGVLNQRSEVSQIPLKLYLGVVRKDKLSFEEKTSAFKLPAEPTSSVSLIDYDLDGWIDLYVANWFDSKDGKHLPVADRLLRNNKGRFEDKTAHLRGEDFKKQNELYPPNARPTYGASTCDVDQNGYPDILTASSSGYKNKLWMNVPEARTGERFFEDLGLVSGYAADPDGSLIDTGGGRTFFSACTDYNDDGLMDVFLGELSHAYDTDSVDRSSILTGAKETYPPYFMRTEYVSDANNESWNQGDRRGIWMDYNLDGKIDLVVDNSGFPPYSRLVIFEQDETRAFLNVAPQLGTDIVNPIGTITMDINQDGLPDLITAQNNIRRADITPRLYVFENQNRVEGRRAIRVHVQGLKANTDGLGAMVMLYTKVHGKNVVQRRWAEYSQGGLPSQNESGVLFGVDSGVEAVGVKVRWPYKTKVGFSSGTIREKLYSLPKAKEQRYLEVTVCEDGKILTGKISCQF